MLARTALGQPLPVALLLMLVSVLGYSSLPVFVFRAGGFDSPFLFNFLWRVFMLSVILLFLLVFHRSLLLSPSCWREVRRQLWDWRILVLSVSYTVRVTPNRLVASKHSFTWGRPCGGSDLLLSSGFRTGHCRESSGPPCPDCFTDSPGHCLAVLDGIPSVARCLYLRGRFSVRLVLGW